MRRKNFCRATLGAILAAAVALIGVAGLPGSSARPRISTVEQNAIFIDVNAPRAAREKNAAALLDKARARGQVRVIAGFGIALRADHVLAAAESVAQTVRLHAAQNALAARAGIPAHAVTAFDYIPFVSLWANAAQLNRLLSDPSLVNIQEDVPGHAGLNLSAPFIKADQLWTQKIKGNGFAVAIVDTGVDKSHPMLADKVVSEACYSTANAAQGVTSLCRGGVTQSTAVGAGANCPNNLDPCWHGTHIAAIAVGRPVRESVGIRLTGIAPNAKLISIKVFSSQGGKAVTFDSDWIRGLERVYALRKQFRIAAVNLSFGSGKFTGPCDAQNAAAKKIMRALRQVNIAVIAASMNDGYDGATEEPACISEAIAVGATLHTENTIADYSNHAPWVRLLAPGTGIVSAKAGGGFRSGDGTSMAAPHVAGAFALMRDAVGSATVNDISAALECTGPLVTRGDINKPRIDVLAAKAYLLAPPTLALDFTFDAPSAPPGWVSVLGLWQPTGGYYQPRDNGIGYKLAVLPNCNESADITAVRMLRLGSDTQSVQGVIFKAQFTNDRNMSGYLGGYDRQGHAQIERLDNFDIAANTGARIKLCGGVPSLSGDNFNTVQVQTRGNTHKLLINGALICAVHDSTYSTGSTGILAYFGAAGGTNALAVDEFTLQPAEVVPNAALAEDLIVAAEPPI